MKIASIGAGLVAGAITCLCAGLPANAASASTKLFLENATPNVDFLDRSSRMALTNSKNTRLRAFALSEAAEQTKAANAIYDWTKASPPVAVASADSGQVLTGRSAAVDGQTAQLVDNRLPLGQEDLDGLEGLNGKEFDDTYKAKQSDALNQMKTDYQDYVVKGDDPALKAIAARELPNIERRLTLLRKL